MGPFTTMRSPEVGTWGGHTDSRCGNSMASTARHDRGQMMPVRVYISDAVFGLGCVKRSRSFSSAPPASASDRKVERLS